MKRSLISLILLPLLLAACAGAGGDTASLSNTHVHGLAVDRGDSNRVYIATHNGTFVLTDDKDLTIVGDTKDDYMGFSPHPTDAAVLFSSGHPQGGGNLGIQRSDDGGQTWKKLANGDPFGPVDFHSMAVGEVNPDILYGWYRGNVYRSVDGGTTWKVLGQLPPVVSFATDLRDDTIVYAGTLTGLLKSSDQGETWVTVPEFENDSIVDMEMEPRSGNLIIATEKQGIVGWGPDGDGRISIEKMGATFPDGSIPSQIAVDRKNPLVLYATVEHTLYKSADSGKTWQKVL